MPTVIVLGRRQIDHDLALADDRVLVLADLIALRQIGIEIVLAVEHRAMIDLRLEAEAGADRLRDAFLVDHRQHARHGRVDQRDLAVGLAAEFGRGAGEQLGLAGDLGVDLHADDDFPVAGRALISLDELACVFMRDPSPLARCFASSDALHKRSTIR